MKKVTYIKTYFIGLAMAFLSLGTVSAQEIGGGNSTATEKKTTEETKIERINKPSEERAVDITNNMATELHLNDKQKKQVYTINLEAAKQMDAIRVKYRKDPEMIVKEGRKVDKEHDKKLSDILTPSQWSQYMHGKGRG
jgi:hypothetical protein